MADIFRQTLATIIPCLRYRNAAAAINWLRDTFDFVLLLIVPSSASATA